MYAYQPRKTFTVYQTADNLSKSIELQQYQQAAQAAMKGNSGGFMNLRRAVQGRDTTGLNKFLPSATGVSGQRYTGKRARTTDPLAQRPHHYYNAQIDKTLAHHTIGAQ